MSKKKVMAMAILFSLLVGIFAGCGSQSGDEQLKFAFLNQIDTWPAYSAIQDGTAEKYGLKGYTTKENLVLFESGMPMVEALASNSWQIGDSGSVPTLMAALRYDAKIVGIASNESSANAVVARKNNPVFAVPNKKYPKAFGDAATVKGKTILVATVSGAHYVVDCWLKSMGLTEKDVTINNLEQPQAIKSFESGQGDFLALWSPELYQAYDKGYRDVAVGNDIEANMVMLYFVPKEIAENKGKAISQFLAMTSDKVSVYQREGVNLTKDLQKYFQDFGALKFSDEEVKLDIERHQLYTIDEQLELIKNGQLELWMSEIADFFIRQGKFNTEDIKKLEKLKENHFNITGQFLKEAKEMKV